MKRKRLWVALGLASVVGLGIALTVLSKSPRDPSFLRGRQPTYTVLVDDGLGAKEGRGYAFVEDFSKVAADARAELNPGNGWKEVVYRHGAMAFGGTGKSIVHLNRGDQANVGHLPKHIPPAHRKRWVIVFIEDSSRVRGFIRQLSYFASTGEWPG